MKDYIKKKDPIGSWVKRADYVFSNIVRKPQDGGTFKRIDWQLLNFLYEKNRVTIPEIINFLSFFEQEQEIRKLIKRFLKKGIITIDKPVVTITPKGIYVFKEVSEIQEEIKQKALQGIDKKAYATTIETIQKITNNLREYLPDKILSLNTNNF